jgi:hypothetical protein
MTGWFDGYKDIVASEKERKRQQREVDSGTLEIVAESGAVCLSGVVKFSDMLHRKFFHKLA